MSSAFSSSNDQTRRIPSDSDCPCLSGSEYGSCCEPYLSRAAEPPTAEACMRSRYTAYVLRDADHLFRTWHPSTRPDDMGLSAVSWSGLSIEKTYQGGQLDDMGQVEFRAQWKLEDGVRAELHEVSNFHRLNGRWLYLSGEHHFHTR